MEPEFESRIRIRKDYGDLPRVYCSPSSLNQVFINLLKNASESIEGDGEIAIKTFAREGDVTIEISDTGRGIPNEHKAWIFDPGFTTKGTKVGMGLGLSICYEIVVNKHQGRIDVSSNDKGTTFTITMSATKTTKM
jgi:signal transduction histidine kinase